MKLIVASGNAKKVKEIKEILDTIIPNAEILSLKDVYDPVPEIPETGVSFFENSYMKGDWVNSREKCWVLADDSGLQVDALDGAPGIYSARYAGEPCDDAKNNAKLLDALKDVPTENRTARFRCVMTLFSPEGEPFGFNGKCEGKIITERQGEGGFGYDPLFVPNGYEHSFAELGSDIKNTISHRANALMLLKGKLQELFS